MLARIAMSGVPFMPFSHRIALVSVLWILAPIVPAAAQGAPLPSEA